MAQELLHLFSSAADESLTEKFLLADLIYVHNLMIGQFEFYCAMGN